MNKAGHSLFPRSKRGLLFPPQRRGRGRFVLRCLGPMAALLCWPLAAPAQVVKLLDYTNVWHYNETVDLYSTQPTWTAPAYDDSSWKSGEGVLAFEFNIHIVPLIRTVLPSPESLSPPNHAIYFRTRFTSPVAAPAFLTLSNLIDDGAVFHLNGVEMQRIRVASGSVSNMTRATITSTETVPDLFRWFASNLVAGDNVLAVSVHQADPSQGDIDFGTAMWIEPGEPVRIIAEPQDQTVDVLEPVSFSVTAGGTHPQFQWQFNGLPITGATNANYAISKAALTNAGEYRVVVFSPMNVVTSRVAVLTVVPTPPVLLSAVADYGVSTPFFILLRFNEPVSALTATDKSNYVVSRGDSVSQLTISNAQVNGAMVRLVVSAWDTNADYFLEVNNVTDLGGSIIAPDTRIGIAFWRPVLPMNAFWNWCEDFDLTGQDWTSPAYNEATNEWYSGGQWIIPDPTWDPIGRAVFYFPVVSLGGYTVSGGPLNTVLTFGRTTYYFRTRFVLPANTSGAGVIKFRHLVDDGAVFYLNGVEVMRVGVPPGPLAYETPASTQRGSSAYALNSLDLLVTNLIGGANIVAVELKPASTLPFVEYGICFGTEVSVASAPVVPPAGSPLLPVALLDIARAGDGGVVLRWDAPGCVLQAKSRVEDEWSDLPGATSPFTNAVTATRFFRLHCP